jgi:hypothetical protein
MDMTSVFDKITEMNIDVNLDQETRFVDIKNFNCKVDGKKVSVKNREGIENSEDDREIPFVSAYSNINFGIIFIDEAKDGIPVSIPVYMVTDEKGTLFFEGLDQSEKFYVAGPEELPRISGRIRLKGAEVQVPFESGDEGAEKGIIARFLEKANWDVKVESESDNEYYSELPITLQEVASNPIVSFRIDDNSEGLHFKNSMKEGEFFIDGSISSSKGTVEYLDDIFRVEEFKILFNEFNYKAPLISGSAKIVKRDSTITSNDLFNDGRSGLPVTVTLKIETEMAQNGNQPGTISGENESTYKILLESDSPEYGNSISKILALFGYSSENIMGKATEMLGYRTSRLFLRPILNPIERKFRRMLSLDQFSIRPRITGNLLSGLVSDIGSGGFSSLNGDLLDPKFLFRSSELSVGKYFTDDLYVSWVTALTSDISQSKDTKLGFGHLFGLEYKLSRSLFFETQFDYNYERYIQRGADKKIFLRYVFPLTDK